MLVVSLEQTCDQFDNCALAQAGFLHRECDVGRLVSLARKLDSSLARDYSLAGFSLSEATVAVIEQNFSTSYISRESPDLMSRAMHALYMQRMDSVGPMNRIA